MSELNSKPHVRKGIRNIIDRAIGVHLYLPLGPEHYKLCQTGSMATIKSMINTAIIIRRKWRDLYNVLHPNCARKPRTRIYSTNTYT